MRYLQIYLLLFSFVTSIFAPFAIKGTSLTPKSSFDTVKAKHRSETSPVYVFRNMRLLYLHGWDGIQIR